MFTIEIEDGREPPYKASIYINIEIIDKMHIALSL